MGTNAYRDPGPIRVFDADYGFNLPGTGSTSGSLATVIGNLLADIAYAVLDPRVRYVSA
jgi:hypothetical protein